MKQQLALIDIDHVSFGYPKQEPLLTDISLRVFEGERVTIVGPNGSGKSTLTKLLNGLLVPLSGTVRIDHLKLRDETISSIRKIIGMVFQNPDNQFVGNTVQDDILFGLENLCLSHSEMEIRLKEITERFGIIHLLDKHPAELSGGQKQKVALASVFAMQPRILIMDEATSMLDESAKEEMAQIVTVLHKESGITSITVTHDADEILASDRVIAIKDGRIFADVTPKQLFLREDWLKACNLLPPFSMEVAQLLKKTHPNISLYHNEEELVEELWQLYSTT
ncbi:ATP-binding cassette domain-containing protein [Brevibacillus daliensis]|uniref:ATP-binding cassette domain-containing protein n=1 Tax=Brevibacillus daliensis TaxID=2892995 RepID=UPI001E4F9259|nr:ATP-binding cassette domain-containing protein [Brevibacillus daliensis]